MRVLVVGALRLSNQTLAGCLQSSNVVVDQTEQGLQAVELTQLHGYDAVLADMALPDIDGFELVRQLRAVRVDTPVILMAEQMQPQVRVKAFSLGADDFITKPYDPAELLARVQAIVRRNKGHRQSMLQCGPLQLNLDSCDVYVAGHPVRLTGKEYAILELLVLRRGMVLSKEVFLNHLYGGMDEPEMKIIDVFICKLRRKLAEAGAPDIIGTVRGRGYLVRASNPGNQPMRPIIAPCSAPAMALSA